MCVPRARAGAHKAAAMSGLGGAPDLAVHGRLAGWRRCDCFPWWLVGVTLWKAAD